MEIFNLIHTLHMVKILKRVRAKTSCSQSPPLSVEISEGLMLLSL
jgi:hypothetical protein